MKKKMLDVRGFIRGLSLIKHEIYKIYSSISSFLNLYLGIVVTMDFILEKSKRSITLIPNGIASC